MPDQALPNTIPNLLFLEWRDQDAYPIYPQYKIGGGQFTFQAMMAVSRGGFFQYVVALPVGFQIDGYSFVVGEVYGSPNAMRIVSDHRLAQQIYDAALTKGHRYGKGKAQDDDPFGEADEHVVELRGDDGLLYPFKIVAHLTLDEERQFALIRPYWGIQLKGFEQGQTPVFTFEFKKDAIGFAYLEHVDDEDLARRVQLKYMQLAMGK